MKAQTLVEKFPEEDLIGRIVWTQPMGQYPGGWAMIKVVHPDNGADEIVLGVCHPTEGDMGIFYYENVGVRDWPFGTYWEEAE